MVFVLAESGFETLQQYLPVLPIDLRAFSSATGHSDLRSLKIRLVQQRIETLIGGRIRKQNVGTGLNQRQLRKPSGFISSDVQRASEYRYATRGPGKPIFEPVNR